MKATDTDLFSFFEGPKQFASPIFHPTDYRWTIKQCEELWQDIIKIGKNKYETRLFIGHIVYIETGFYHISSIPQLLVIYGQQQLATLSLLISALCRNICNDKQSEFWQKEFTNCFLINSEEKGDLRYKLRPAHNDRDTFFQIVEGKEVSGPASKCIMDNYCYFKEMVDAADVDIMTIYQGIARLWITDTALDWDNDKPQLLLERLNSTDWLSSQEVISDSLDSSRQDLCQANLIRNYFLMRLEPQNQESIYGECWYPMEESFGQESAGLFDHFIRDYLVVKTGVIHNIQEVYEAFKVYAQDETVGSVYEIIEDLYRFSRHFVNIALDKEPDMELREAFRDINILNVDMASTLLLALYEDYYSGKMNNLRFYKIDPGNLATLRKMLGEPPPIKRLSREDFLKIIRLIESYVFRRAICGITSKSLYKTFAYIRKNIYMEAFVDSFTAALLLKDSYQRFPNDDEFVRELVKKDVSVFHVRTYLLRKFENYDRKEYVDIDGYTIEHIMPQNLSTKWRNDLGKDWKKVHETYLHTIGNITLKNYGQELSDRPFLEKCGMPGGFADSPLRLNRGLGNLEKWGEKNIKERACWLAKLATKIWPFPQLSPEVIERYRKAKRLKAVHLHRL